MESIENQLKKREYINTKIGTIKVLDLVPEKIDKQIPPIFYIPGWAETIESSREIIISFARKGYRVLAADFNTMDTETFNVYKYPEIEYRRTVGVINALGAKKINKVHIIGHSEGAVNAVIVARLSPSLAESVTLVSPGGIVVRRELAPLIFRYLKYLAIQFEVRSWHSFFVALTYVKEALKFCLFNPIQAAKQVASVNEVDVIKLIIQLQEKGVPVYVIHGFYDIMIDSSLLKKELQEIQFTNLHMVEGGHNYVNTNADEFTALYQEIIR